MLSVDILTKVVYSMATAVWQQSIEVLRMSEKVSVTLKVEGIMKALMEACAKVDRRTLSAYVESLVAEDAKVKKISVDDVMVKDKEPRVAADKPALALPDFIDPEIWSDFVEHRKTLKKPINESTLRYMIPGILKAHHNGWDVNELITHAISEGWKGFVFNDPHFISRPGGKEVVVKGQLSPAEVVEKKEKLLNNEGLVAHNKDRFVDYALIVQFIDMAFATDQPLEMKMLSTMLDKFYKSGNKEKCNQWVRDLIESQNILDDDGEFIAMRGFQ